jgi:hypothetical protein
MASASLMAIALFRPMNADTIGSVLVPTVGGAPDHARAMHTPAAPTATAAAAVAAVGRLLKASMMLGLRECRL